VGLLYREESYEAVQEENWSLIKEYFLLQKWMDSIRLRAERLLCWPAAAVYFVFSFPDGNI
jgi:hypothetical protein